MSKLFAKSHEWFDKNENTIGISDYAAKELGDVVYAELPEVGDTITAGTSFMTIESVKAVSDVYAPVSGEITEVNEELLSAPELINEKPYEAWLVKVEPSFVPELLSEEAYKEII